MHNDFGGLSEPSDTLALLPLTLALVTLLGIDEHTHAMLNVVSPVSRVLVAIRELHVAVSVFLTILESTSVLSTILVNKVTLTLEDTVDKLALVHAFGLSEVVLALTMEFTLNELSFVPATVFPFVAALSFFLTEHVITSVLASITNNLSTLTVLLVIEPSTLISRNLSLEYTVSIGRVLLPLTLVHVTSSVGHATDT